MFRLMEAALNGVASPRAERALHYFFGESIAEPLSRLTELPGILGLPPGIRGIICGDEANLSDYIREADYLVVESARVTRDLIHLGRVRLRLIGQVQGPPLQRNPESMSSASTSFTAFSICHITRRQRINYLLK